MWPDQLPDSLTRLVTPRAIRVYAEGLGWQRVEGVNGKIAVYKNPDSPLRQLIVPLDEQFADRHGFWGGAVFAGFHKAPRFRRRSRNSLWPSKLSAPIFRQPTSVQQSLLPFPRPRNATENRRKAVFCRNFTNRPQNP